MQRAKISAEFSKNNLLVSSEGFEKIIKEKIDVAKVILAAKEKNVWLVTDEFLQEFVVEPPKEEKEEKVEIIRKGRDIPAKDIEADIKIDTDSDVTGKSTSEGVIENFVEYFNQKYTELARILRGRPNLRDATLIKNVSDAAPVSVIGMVLAKRESKRGFRFLDIEDPSGQLTVLISQDKDHLVRIYDSTVTDEVIGVSGRMHKDLLIAEEIMQPDIPVNHKPNTAEEDVCLACLSDMHVGSYLFLEKEFNSFLKWLAGDGNRNDLSGRIKYITIAGDLVDGIGIYPNQEYDLALPDIYKQYDMLGRFLERIPDYIEVIIAPGNHDAVRRAEPEPQLPRDICAPLYDLSNVHMVGNPARVKLHGVDTLVYHGDSMDSLISGIGTLSYSKPETAMIEYLKRRHLAPVYNDIAPETKDYMVIKDVPDIFHCGHVHANGYTIYRGVHVINSGTWQGQTKYQERQGHMPTPARLPVMNLENHEVTVLHFGG